MQKQLTAFTKLFSKNALSQIFDKVMNTLMSKLKAILLSFKLIPYRFGLSPYHCGNAQSLHSIAQRTMSSKKDKNLTYIKTL